MVLLAMMIFLIPFSLRCLVHKSIISPAPTNKAVCSDKSAKILSLSFTAQYATEIGDEPISVSVLTFFAVEKAC